jgi:two-component system, response regulator
VGETNVDILLVEDNPSDVKLALRAFQKHDPETRLQVVRDGAEVLEYLFCMERYAERRIEDRPKLVLLDLKIPLIEGTEVLRRIKSDSRTQMIPVVVMTSSKEPRDVAECYRLGVNSYIVKPVDFTEFTEIVRYLSTYWLRLNLPTEEIMR